MAALASFGPTPLRTDKIAWQLCAAKRSQFGHSSAAKLAEDRGEVGNGLGLYDIGDDYD